ncbi:MAG TPA: DUF4870 domain-containing protein [Candidatus Elarobacter sp.]|nr:DUF4870 domain-containing protein [Candidatus Elarobacter sp.]
MTTCPSCATQSTASSCPSCGTALVPYPGAPVTTLAAPAEARNWAMGCHLSSLLGLFVPFGNLIGPLICWLVKRDQSPLVDANGKESLNFQISMTIWMVISGVLIFVLIGIPMLLVLAVLDIVFSIIAAIKTSNGEPYRYPLTIRFLR